MIRPILSTLREFVLLLFALVQGVEAEENIENPSTQRSSDNDGGVLDDSSALEDEDNGYSLHIDKDTKIIPTARNCFYCCQEGKLHPIEYFTMYPCCNYMICLDCIRKPEHSNFCGECLTQLPFGVNENALTWLSNREPSYRRYLSDYNRAIRGAHTFVDELMMEPIYSRKKRPDQLLAVMNPPNVKLGVALMSKLAQSGYLSAELDVAEAYNTSYFNDPFERDTKLAEYWFRRALGDSTSISPLAFTRYGQFLKYEARFKEALEKFMVAAEFGHSRGQYEYARLVLSEGIQKYSTEEKTKAIAYLCEACEKGFCIPTFVLLAQTLISTAEELYGTADLVGNSPLPRAIQIFKRVESCCNMNYCEDNQERTFVTNSIEESLKRFDNSNYCSNCGSVGTEEYPLRSCDRCGVSRYCSKICQRKHFRDGHKYDCCDENNLLDFHSIKTTLPWTKDSTKTGDKEVPILRGNDITKATLIQMVEDDTDEIYGEDDPDYDELILAQLMLRMRKNVEIFLSQSIPVSNDKDIEGNENDDSTNAITVAAQKINTNLNKQIIAFSRMNHVSDDFVQTLHKIREYGNIAAHRDINNSTKLDRTLFESAVRSFRQQKKEYTAKGTMRSKSTNTEKMNKDLSNDSSKTKSQEEQGSSLKEGGTVIKQKENKSGPVSASTQHPSDQADASRNKSNEKESRPSKKKKKKKKSKTKKGNT